VSPKTVQIAVGGHVTFVNNDTRSHDIESNPHPAHTDCPQINQVGPLQPGQSRDTANLSVSRSCGYHDHSSPADTTVQGTIVIQ
jgi:plastocyanin